MAGWLGIDGSNLDSLCGEESGYRLLNALYGTDYWKHLQDESPHWFILDLGRLYTVDNVRARSKTSRDPVDVDIYVSEDKVDWGTAVATGIDTWQDTEIWKVVTFNPRDIRYIRVEINTTETGDHYIEFGKVGGMAIFDVYGEIVKKRRARRGLRYIENGDRLRGLRRNSPY